MKVFITKLPPATKRDGQGTMAPAASAHMRPRPGPTPDIFFGAASDSTTRLPSELSLHGRDDRRSPRSPSNVVTMASQRVDRNEVDAHHATPGPDYARGDLQPSAGPGSDVDDRAPRLLSSQRRSRSISFCRRCGLGSPPPSPGGSARPCAGSPAAHHTGMAEHVVPTTVRHVRAVGILVGHVPEHGLQLRL
jgi:hypothetical protein